MIPPQLYRVKDIAPHIRVSAVALYGWLKRFDLPHVKFGDNCVALHIEDIHFLYSQSGIIDGWLETEIKEQLTAIEKSLAVDVPLRDRYSGKEVGMLLGISAAFVTTLRTRGDLSFMKIGGRYFYKAEAINELVRKFHLYTESLSGYNISRNSMHLNNSNGRVTAYSNSTQFFQGVSNE